MPLAARHAILITVAVLASAAPTARADATERLRPDEWRADVAHLVNEVMRRHPNPHYYGADSQAYHAAADRLAADLDDMTDTRILLELFRLHGMLRDAHSTAVWDSSRHLVRWRRLPIRLYPGRDGWFVMATGRSHRAILGAHVTHLGGRPVEEVAAALGPYVSADNAMNELDFVSDLATMPEVLAELGIVEDPERVRLDLVRQDGTNATAWLEPSWPRRWVRARDNAPAPLWLRRQEDPYWFEYLPDDRLVYLQFNAVTNLPPPGESFEAFCTRLFAFIEANPVKRLAIDLRHNGGGENGISWPLVHGIIRCSKLDRHGRVFAIIGRGSQSAAPTLARRLETHTRCVFVGEPTAGRPNGHGNASTITLPNSRVQFTCSSVFVRETIVPDRRPWIAPDVTAMLSAADYVAGRDPALEAIRRYRPPRSFREIIGDVLDLEDGAAFIQRYEDYRAIHENRFKDLEDEISACGDAFLRAGRRADAIAVFELNQREHPWAWKTYHSLAEAYGLDGRRDEAIELYERSFELNRSNVGALEAIDRLRRAGDAGR